MNIKYGYQKSSKLKSYFNFDPEYQKLNKKFKEQILDLYDKKCLLCNKNEKDNITKYGKSQRLYLDRINYNNQILLVPLCLVCHFQFTNNREDYKEDFIKILKNRGLINDL